MDLFIFNDYEWHLIEESDEYDKKSFFIVRKLFVQWPKVADAKMCNAIIRAHYEAYGHIELVETVNEEMPVIECDIHEAYVTFARSKDAYHAFIAGRRGTKAIQVLPADTWRQPGVHLLPPEQVKVTLECDDGEKETNFSEILNDGKPICEYTIRLRQPVGLKSLLEGLLPVKEYLEHVKIVFDMVVKDSYVNCLNDREYVKRAIQVICKIVGESLNELTIIGDVADTITNDLLDDLAPVLKLVEFLNLEIGNNASVLYKLHEYCSSTTSMNLISTGWNGDCSNAMAYHWPSLTRLLLEGPLNLDSDTKEVEKFREFIKLNPQLEQIELNTIIDVSILRSIAEHCPKVYAVASVHKDYNVNDTIIDQLEQMKNLTTLKLSFLMIELDEVDALTACVERFRKMEQLKFVTLFQNLEPNTKEPANYIRMVTYDLKLHDGCFCHGSDDRKLELDGVDGMLDLPKNRPVIATVFNTMNLRRSNADIELAMAPITSFEKVKKFYPNVVAGTPIAIENKDNTICIHICYA